MDVYIKAYSRDFSIIMEEAWYYALSRGLWDKLGIKAPNGRPNIYYINKGIIEVWDNKEYIKLIIDGIFRKNGDHSFFESLLKEYETKVSILKKDECGDREFIEILYKAISIFSIVWYGIIDDRTEKMTRQILVGVRDKDTIFDSCDKLVRKRVQKKYPEMRGVDTAIFKDEFLSNTPTREVLKARLENFVFVPGEVSLIINLEEFARKNNVKCEISQTGGTGTVRGITAYPGKVVGKARIIRRKDDISTMQESEVLISPMTTPDVFPVMGKASAIVTDEGGVLCHAAIISRELKIPCVIGTKVASMVYKNGDKLEVDATKGIVKRLS